MQLIKHTEIKTETNEYDLAVISLFGCYWSIRFFGTECIGKPFGGLDAAVEDYEKHRRDTLSYLYEHNGNVTATIKKH